jgi:hypothetical protein
VYSTSAELPSVPLVARELPCSGMRSQSVATTVPWNGTVLEGVPVAQGVRFRRFQAVSAGNPKPATCPRLRPSDGGTGLPPGVREHWTGKGETAVVNGRASARLRRAVHRTRTMRGANEVSALP